MGYCQNLFVGPFVEWLVPEGETDHLPPRNADDERLFGDRLLYNAGLGDPELVTRRGRKYHRYCVMPRALGEGGRDVYFSGRMVHLDIQDLLGVDRQAEVGWFERTFADELAVLAGHFGGDPQPGWGLICWMS